MLLDKHDNFSLKNYKRSISTGISSGYKFFKLKDHNTAQDNELSVLMRHDVDTQLLIAESMSKIENDLGVKATYFFRFHAHSYNPMKINDARVIKRISDLGHEIGLHYEPDYYSMIDSSLENGLKREIEILQEICKKEVVSVAPHEPTRTNSFRLEDSIVKNLRLENQAYDKTILKNNKYISDSSCHWREGSMLFHFSEKIYKNLYVLTHPYWWYESSPIENY